MAGFLVARTRLQLAPVVRVLVAQIDLVAVVACHVHALVRVVLVRNVLQAQFQFEQMGIAAQRKTECVVAGFVAGSAHFFAGPASEAACRWLGRQV